MDLQKLKSIPLSKFNEIRPHAVGWYEGHLVSFSLEQKKGKADDAEEFVEVTLNFTAENPLEAQPMEHVSPNRRYPLRVRIFKEEDTSRIIGIGKTLRPDVLSPIELQEKGEDGGNIESYLEAMVNAAARVQLAEDEWFKEKRDQSVLVVKTVRKAAA